MQGTEWHVEKVSHTLRPGRQKRRDAEPLETVDKELPVGQQAGWNTKKLEQSAFVKEKNGQKIAKTCKGKETQVSRRW